MQLGNVSDVMGTAKRQPSPEQYWPADGGHHAPLINGDFGTSPLKRRYPDGFASLSLIARRGKQ